MDLENLFKKLNLKGLKELVANGEPENLHLEFKTVNSARLMPEDKKNFAKALSGFSNANGGLIIWGIYGAKNDDGVDCALELKTVDQVSLLLSNLETHTGQWVDPQVRGVHHRVIFSDRRADRGCVISFIPESDGGPHMSSFEGRYYTRSGSSFYRMTHSQVADRFFRKRVPNLKLYTRLSSRKLMKVHQEEYVDFELIVGLENTGKGIAKYPYLSMRVLEPYVVSHGGLDGNGHEGVRRFPKGSFRDPIRWGAGAETVIHAGGILEVTMVKPPLAVPPKHVGKDLLIEYEICAEDAETVSGTEVVVRYSELEKSLRASDDTK
jgi:hypothetical protein